MATGIEGLRAGRAGAAQGPRAALDTPVLLLLIWLFGASACLLLYLGSKLTFLLDDWEFLLYRRDFDLDAILKPHGEHIVVLPVLIYKALLATVGMGSALPFRVVSTALFLLSAALLFAYLRRRVGQWPALAATAVVLFLGAAWEDLLWPFQIGYFGCMAAGLGALLALEAEERRGEALACVLLVLAVLFSSLGLSFAIAAGVHVLLGAERRRRLYVFLVPLAVYALWWLGWGHTAETAFGLTNVAKTPLYVLNGFAASIASALGLANHGITGNHRLDWGRAIGVGLIFLTFWRLYRLQRTPHWFWVALALGGSFWIFAGFNQMAGRDPDASRYQYLGVVFLFMVGAELLRAELERGLRLGPKVLALGALVLAFSLASNIESLVSAWHNTYHPISQLEKADLGALEIAEATVEPGFLLSEDVADTGFVNVDAGSYLSARDAYGSPAYDEAEIAAAPEFARYAADKVLFGALRMELEPLPGSAAPARAPLASPKPGEAIVVPGRGCVGVPSDGSVSPLLSLPRTGVLVRAGDEPIGRFDLQRFAAAGEFPILIEGIGAGEAGKLAIPPDKARTPWKMQLETATPAVACGLEGGS